MSHSDQSKRIGLKTRARFWREIRQLDRLVADEGLRLAKAVRRGEITRAQVQAAYDKYGDGEPYAALEILDRWGIH